MGRALLILVFAAALAACGRDPRSGAIPAADSPANPTEPADAPASSVAAHVSAAAPASGIGAD